MSDKDKYTWEDGDVAIVPPEDLTDEEQAQVEPGK